MSASTDSAPAPASFNERHAEAFAERLGPLPRDQGRGRGQSVVPAIVPGLVERRGREKAEAYFRSAGFSDISVHELDHDFQNYWYVCRP